jgi:hypothetical protein
VAKNEVKSKKQQVNKERMADGIKSEFRNKASGVTYAAGIDRPTKKTNPNIIVVTDGAPPQKKQRRIPGPCSSCGGMGHASNNNKKCPNCMSKKKAADTSTVTPTPAHGGATKSCVVVDAAKDNLLSS